MKPVTRLTRGQGARATGFLAGAVLALSLSACASSVTELPDSAVQAESAAVGTYPQVHDMPPVRVERSLSDEEQRKLQQELLAAGQSQPALAEEIAQDTHPEPPRPAGRQPASSASTGRRSSAAPDSRQPASSTPDSRQPASSTPDSRQPASSTPDSRQAAGTRRSP